MRSDIDSIISALSIRLFQIPPDCVQAAIDIAQADPDRSLVETLSELGHLKEDERSLLDSLSAELDRYEAPTRTGWASGAGPDPAAMAALARMRDAADRMHGNGTRYAVRGEHARGGMGRILTVWDRHMRREVALKELLPAGGGDPAAGKRVVARFLREARITGRLQHPSIIPVHEIGVRGDGTFYYTMKHVRGRTLRQAIAGAATLEERMALLPHYRDLCLAIAYAHAHGVIHRDIKPSNVMIGEFGETQVIDWGLAKEMDTGGERGRGETDPSAFAKEEPSEPELTMNGQLLGTPHYMAPEQAAGKHDTLDERADVYALGAVLYELLTGIRPYQASTGLEVLRKLAVSPPDPPEQVCPDAPPALAAICRRAMEREPGARYASAEDLAREIERFQAGARVSAYEYGTAELLARFLRRHRPVVATACVALAVLAGVVAVSYLGLRARHAAERALRIQGEQKGYDMSILMAQRALEEYRYEEARDALAACPIAYRDWEWGHLSHALDEVQFTSDVDHPAITEAELAPDGKSILALGPDGGVKLWKLPELTLERAFESLPVPAWSVSFHPDGEEFATYAAGGNVARWRLDSTLPLGTLAIDGGEENDALDYAPDGRALVAAANARIEQWDLGSNAMVRSFPAEARLSNDLAFSPDGRWLASAGDTGRVQIWDWASGQSAALLDAHMTNLQVGSQGALRVSFSPDSTLLATSGCDATAKLWETGSWLPRHTLAGHMKKVVGVEFSHDGSTLATHSERMVKLWDTRTGDEKADWIRCDQGIRRVLFHPDGKRLVTVESRARITVWNLAAGAGHNFLTGHTSELNAVRFSPDGRYLASSAGHWLTGGDSRVLIWDLAAAGRSYPDAPLRSLVGDGRWINHLAFHPDGRSLSGADANGQIITWDSKTGERRHALEIPEYDNGARCVIYSPDGALMATAGWGVVEIATVDLWDVKTNQRLRTFTGPTLTVDTIAFSPDGTQIAAGSRDGTVHLWEVQSGEIVRVIDAGEKWIYGVAFSPDGALIAGSCASSAVLLWDARTGTLRHRLNGLQSRANKVAVNPEATRVAACDETTTRVWSVETGAELLSLPHGGQDVAFSPDGLTLATAGFDGRIGLWRADDWRVSP